MSDQNNGGAAFPSPNNVVVGDCISGGHEGMTLRDYFAAKAMHALMSTPKPDFGRISPGSLSEMAYQMADAMLKSRQA